jgi:hypothetical protein
MQTVTLKLEDSISDKVLWLLKQFDKDKVEIVNISSSLKKSDLSAVKTFRELRAKSDNKETLTMDIATDTQGLIDDAIF